MSPYRPNSDGDAPQRALADTVPSDTAAVERRAISEDWLATVVGLVLLILVLTGVLTGDWVWVP